MRTPHRYFTAILCCSMTTLAACDSANTLLTPQPDAGSARMAVVSTGLQAFYSFDQPQVTGATAAHRPTGGYQGGAYYFDGTAAAYVDLPVNVNPANMPQMTMGAWAKAATLPSTVPATVLSHDNSGWDRTIGIDNRSGPNGSFMDGKHRFSAFTGAGVLSGPVAETNRWVFLAAVYNAGTVKLYVDGVEYSTSGTPAAGLTTLRVGGNPAASPIYKEPFHGIIDNVFVYNRALSSEEITTIRTRGACAITATCVGIPAVDEVRGGLTQIGTLLTLAAGELTPSRSRQLSKLLTLGDGYLDQANTTSNAQRRATMLRYVLVELDEALGLLRGTGSATTAARVETLRVRALVQARLDAI
jgi:Concanavalin A-like lectin/glucanases superfamily